MASSFASTSNNISLYTIPAAWVASLAPHVYSHLLYQKVSSRHTDNRQPRSMVKTVAESQGIDAATKGRIIRADAAHQNSTENLPLFAAAVVAGNMARLDTSWLNVLSVGYVLSRVVYNLLYINNTTAVLARARSLVFVSGAVMVCTLFTMAGNKLRSLQI